MDLKDDREVKGSDRVKKKYIYKINNTQLDEEPKEMDR